MLRSHTFILSGGSRGIGRALALEMADRGADLVLNARTESLLRETCEMCLEKNVRADYVTGDIATDEVCSELVHRALNMDNFHGFLHVAGVLHPGPFIWEISDTRYRDIMDASLKGAYQLIRQSVPVLMDRGRGMAVFFGSGAAEIVQPGIGLYCAAKAAEEHLARQLMKEARSLSTLVFRPGIVETRMQKQARESTGGAAEELQDVFQSWKNQGMLISPEEVAVKLCDLLESDESNWRDKTLDIRDI